MTGVAVAGSAGAPPLRHSEADFVAAVQAYAAQTLAPQSLDVDRSEVPAARVAEFSRLGLLNHVAPAQFGGAELSTAADRLIHEAISAGCFNTWLVWAQHAPFVGKLAKSFAAGEELPERARDILAGRVLLGAAISDVRRYPDQFIEAVRIDHGWRVSGTISWVSGWGLNQVLVVAAVDATTDRVVTGFVEVGSGLRAEELGLSAVAGSRTVRVHLDAVDIADEDVISVETVAAWRARDLTVATDARPHHFGLAFAVLDELDGASAEQAHQVASRWRPRIEQYRADTYALSDEVIATGDGRHRLAERLSTKVAVGEALGTLTRALVVARSGHALGVDDTAQLYARSALFVLVQGQSADVRQSQLLRLAR